MKTDPKKGFKTSLIMCIVSFCLLVICIIAYIYLRTQVEKQEITDYEIAECTIVDKKQTMEKASIHSKTLSHRYYYTIEYNEKIYEIKRAKQFQTLTYKGSKITLYIHDGEFYESYTEMQNSTPLANAYMALILPAMILFFMFVVSCAFVYDFRKKAKLMHLM